MLLPSIVTIAPSDMDVTFPIRSGICSPVDFKDISPNNKYADIVHSIVPPIIPTIAAAATEMPFVFFHTRVSIIGATAEPISIPITRYTYCRLSPI
jgi:hypothetical protein